jgi:hypothetical protein
VDDAGSMVERQPDLERRKEKPALLRVHEPVFGAGTKSRKPQQSSLLIQRKNSEAVAALRRPATREP